MNYRLLCRLLGIVCVLIGGSMLFSLPWALPGLANRTGADTPGIEVVEWDGVAALLGSVAVCVLFGAMLIRTGRSSKGAALFQKEAMAVVGLSWVLATVLGALPFWFSRTQIRPGEPVTFIESMFEAQSGFSTTGATVLTNLENPDMVPYCILFWRSSTHFLGGLGIVVLFVAILGQGSAGKAMMRAEMPGPTKEGSMPRMQATAWAFAGIYIGLNLILILIYRIEGMSMFDAVCHGFGTMATGGFSTWNASLGHFNSAAIDYTTIIFMILAGTNFTLLYLSLFDSPRRLFRDTEWRFYLGIIGVLSALIIFFGMRHHDAGFDTFSSSLRYSLFQVVSVITTTGYGTGDFDNWNNFGRGSLLLLMFVGGCAGSTGGGLKVIRHVLFYKILLLEVERVHHPRVVRPLTLGGSPTEDQELRKSIPVYFCLILGIFIASWLILITFEPSTTWGADLNRIAAVAEVMEEADPAADSNVTRRELKEHTLDEKLLDCASAVAATLNNIGPGLGVTGPTKNYAGFSQGGKLLFVWLMMLGRVEVFSVLVLLMPSFWRRF
ncbi:TrkH family potassium uptake protein [Rosistilla oblonga]|uniref:Trk system potassium uptake protein TrkG n=1 Tax=Rosistilla oblonga TaxID=2527990 RepID=A0A518IVR4_9BACT|nr:TrkH family potassium uptake protein [Rosistilla oblonga]QDV57178.1 Trk system potassium uptake protein TrkG [Rosistilla oblonga]